MINKQNKNEIREKRHSRIRYHLSGTQERPRMNVYRSTSHIYVQLIDDVAGRTLVSSSTLSKDININDMNKVQAAVAVGKDVAKKALEKGIKNVVFDRGGYLYTGRVKALADGAREAGLQF